MKRDSAAATAPRRIGLFGGCFNPVHNGHLLAARSAAAHLGLDEVRFIPTGEPPLRRVPDLLEGRHRLAMLKLATADDSATSVSAVELDRTGPSFTVDTVELLRSREPSRADWFFLLGADCLHRLPGWKGFQRLGELVRFAILPREGQALGRADDPLLLNIPMPECAISSTRVREAVAQGDAIGHLVPPPVETYIRTNQLYSATR